MKSMKTMMSLLLVSAVSTTPAFANYFSNSKWNTVLNIGSARSPTPEMLRAIGDSNYQPAPRNIEPEAVAPAEDENLNNESYDEQSRLTGGKTTVAKNVARKSVVKTAAVKPSVLTAMEGKPVFGAKGERLGTVLAVDQKARLIDLQTPSGIAVSMHAALLSDKGKRVDAKTVSGADVMAMAKSQTHRTVAMTVPLKTRTARG